MVGFGSKQTWLAVRDGEAAAVREALRLRDLGPVAWRAGIDLAYLTDDRVVLTPVLDGAGGSRWLLVTGRWLWNAEEWLSVTDLSAELDTEVHRYASNRSMELHEWERADGGTLVRGFAYDGKAAEVLRWIGDSDPAEAELGLRERPDSDEDILVGESDVMRLAGLWSVDPSGLDGRPATGPLHAAAPNDQVPTAVEGG
jgi:hypothetical protein